MFGAERDYLPDRTVDVSYLVYRELLLGAAEPPPKSA
jgi:hypothetical protein